MKITERSSGTRKATNLSLNARLLEEAKSMDINISRAAEAGVAEAVARVKRERWRRENSAALASSNTYVEGKGLPLARYRQF